MKLMVLDGNSLVNRAFFGIKLLTTKDGRYTNAIYGFLEKYREGCDVVYGVRRDRSTETATRPPATACPRSWPSRCRF